MAVAPWEIAAAGTGGMDGVGKHGAKPLGVRFGQREAKFPGEYIAHGKPEDAAVVIGSASLDLPAAGSALGSHTAVQLLHGVGFKIRAAFHLRKQAGKG